MFQPKYGKNSKHLACFLLIPHVSRINVYKKWWILHIFLVHILFLLNTNLSRINKSWIVYVMRLHHFFTICMNQRRRILLKKCALHCLFLSSRSAFCYHFNMGTIYLIICFLCKKYVAHTHNAEHTEWYKRYTNTSINTCTVYRQPWNKTLYSYIILYSTHKSNSKST